MTDKEIFRAFKKCVKGSINSCVNCPYKLSKGRCNLNRLEMDVIELIKKQQRKIRRLESERKLSKVQRYI